MHACMHACSVYLRMHNISIYIWYTYNIDIDSYTFVSVYLSHYNCMPSCLQSDLLCQNACRPACLTFCLCAFLPVCLPVWRLHIFPHIRLIHSQEPPHLNSWSLRFPPSSRDLWWEIAGFGNSILRVRMLTRTLLTSAIPSFQFLQPSSLPSGTG